MEELLKDLLEANRHQRHDFLNHLQVIWGYLKLNKDEKAIQYIHEITAYLQSLRELNRITSTELAADMSAKVLSIGLNRKFSISIPEPWEVEDKNIFYVRTFFDDFWVKIINKALSDDRFVDIKLIPGKLIFAADEINAYSQIAQSIGEAHQINIQVKRNEIIFSFQEK
ncbi:MAG: Spo0B domain-containing protein [Peptococcaceae bacterium]